MVDAGAPDREPLKPSDWTALGDDKLLEIRMCDLGLKIEGTELETRISFQLHLLADPATTRRFSDAER